MMDEVLVGPDAADDVEGFEEHLARALLVDAEGLEFRRAQAAAEAHVEASAGQIVEHRRLFGDEQRMPERQDVDHAGEPDVARRLRGRGDQQIGRRHRSGRLEMMLEEPDLVDADAFGELDLFELAAKHLRMRRIYARGGRRPDGESHRLILPEFKAPARRGRDLMLLAAAGPVNRLGRFLGAAGVAHS